MERMRAAPSVTAFDPIRARVSRLLRRADLHPAEDQGAAALGLAFWLAAVLTAFCAQYLFTPLGRLTQGRLLFVGAGLLMLVGTILIERRVSVSPRRQAVVPGPWAWKSARQIASMALIVLGVITSLATISLLASWQADRLAAVTWLASIVLVVVGSGLGARNPWRVRLPRLTAGLIAEVSLAIGVVALALALRAPGLHSLPPDVHGDEAAIGNEARRLMAGGDLFGFGWADVPALSFAIPVPAMEIFGNSLSGLRAASVIQGTLSVLLLYLIVRRLFGARPAVLAAFFLAISQWDIHFSRSGTHYMQAQLGTLLVIYFVMRGLESRRAVDFVVAGLAVGFCFEVYYAARLAPVIVAVYLAYRAVTERAFIRRHWLAPAAMALGFLVFVAPMSVAVLESPQALFSRTGQVSLLSAPNMNHAKEHYGLGEAQEVVRIQGQRTLEAFNLSGETSTQYGRLGPLLDFWSAALLALGFVVVLARLGDARYFLIGSWIVLTLVLGAVLTISAPFAPRLVGVIPALMVLPALALEVGWRGATFVFGRRGSHAFGLAAAALLALALFSNYRDYFQEFVKRERPAGFFTLLSRHALATGDGYRHYLIGVPGPSIRYEAVRFLAPGLDGVDVADRPLPLPIEGVPRGKGLDFIIESQAPDAATRLARIRAVYPNGRARIHKTATGAPVFTSYVVPASGRARGAPGDAAR